MDHRNNQTREMSLIEYAGHIGSADVNGRQSTSESCEGALVPSTPVTALPTITAELNERECDVVTIPIKLFSDLIRALQRTMSESPRGSTKTEESTIAEKWHRRPKGFAGQCPVCGCEDAGSDEHRRTPTAECLAATWVSRRKSSKGWQYRAIFPKSRVTSQSDRSTDGKPLPSLVDLVPTESAKEAGHVGLAAYYSESFEPIKLRSRCHNTKRLYRSTLRAFKRFLQRGPVLADLNAETVCQYLVWFRELPRSPHSTEKERCNLLAIWRFACRRGDLTIWPEIEPERLPKRVPRAWTTDELSRIASSCRRTRGVIGGIPARKWWTALLLVLYDTGERISAVLGLTWDNVDLELQWIVCKAEHRKGQREDRAYRIGKDTAAALEAIKAPTLKAVFPWPRQINSLWPSYSKILMRAGLPTDRRSKFHRVRRSTASYYEAAGHDATRFLGHSSRRITESYLDPRICPTIQAADVLTRLTSVRPKR